MTETTKAEERIKREVAKGPQRLAEFQDRQTDAVIAAEAKAAREREAAAQQQQLDERKKKTIWPTYGGE